MSPARSRHTRSERGSVLIYIFIAIIALAALTFAISRGGRQSSATIDRERAELNATQILDYTGAIRRGVQSVMINGAQVDDLCFHDAGWGNNNYDPPAAGIGCPDDTAAIFGKAGGGVSFLRPATDLLDVTQAAEPGYGAWYISGSNAVTGVGSDGGGADSNELLVVLPYVARATCLALNRRLQIPDALNLPGDDPNFDMTGYFNGSFTAGDTLTSANLTGRRSGCFVANTTPADGSYVFYAVLVAR